MKMKILSIVLLLNVSFMKTIIIAAPIELQNKTEYPLFFILSGNEKDLSTLNTNVIVPGKKIISNKAINTPTYLLILHKPEGMGFKYTFPVGKTIDVYIGRNDLRLKSNASFMSTSKVKEKDIKWTPLRYTIPPLYQGDKYPLDAARALGIDLKITTKEDLPYLILGLKKSDNPSRDAIKQAYKKLSLKWHPDKNRNKDTAPIFRLISQAYTDLTK